VICISRVTGAAGEEIGRLVAERLGVRYLDDEIVTGAAERGGVTPADVADAERRKSLITRVLEELGTGLGAEASALARGDLALGDELAPESLQRLVVDVVEEVAAQGDVVIAAHGASFALAQRPDVLRVHVTASPDTRSRRLSESAGLDTKAAMKAIRDSDRSRSDYLRRFYGIDSESPTQYDLVLNTDRLSSTDAADVVARAAA
jgi:Cytidylate kinase-like family